MYIDYLSDKIDEAQESMSVKQEKYFASFMSNLTEGINYYNSLFDEVKDKFADTKESVMKELEESRITLVNLNNKLENLSLVTA